MFLEIFLEKNFQLDSFPYTKISDFLGTLTSTPCSAIVLIGEIEAFNLHYFLLKLSILKILSIFQILQDHN